MALKETPACQFDQPAADFSLPATDGNTWTLSRARGPQGLLVAFICNHCPYVQAIIDRLVADCKVMQDYGIGCIAICANDAIAYPEDGFDKMQQFAVQHNFCFPYAEDASQQVAKAFGAVCTPDFFGYNRDLKLQYRGRFDAAGANFNLSDAAKELLPAMLAIASTGHGPAKQTPSMGCSIKWKG